MTIRIYVANLAKYNDGTLNGIWINLPMDEDDLMESIQVMLGDDEEWAIHDYEAPFAINETDEIERLNEIAQVLEDSSEDKNVIMAILGNWTDIEYGIGIIQDGEYVVYTNCSDMGDVAQEVLEEQGTLDSMPEELRSYFDYDAYGRDLAINGTFLYAGNQTYVEVCNH